MTTSEAIFRCPFEKQGEREGRLLKVELTENRAERIFTARKAFEQFYNNTNLLGLYFSFSENVFENCTSLTELKDMILKFQCDLVAAELDCRLQPYLAYQVLQIPKEQHEETIQKNLSYADLGSRIWDSMEQQGFSPFQGPEMTSQWLRHVFEQHDDNAILIQRSRHLYRPLALLARHGMVIFEDRERGDSDPVINKNLFSIVTTPFYPKSFGRYSEVVQVVYTREADMAKLDNEHKQRRLAIRKRANTIHKKHGVPIEDLEWDAQPLGLWIP